MMQQDSTAPAGQAGEPAAQGLHDRLLTLERMQLRPKSWRERIQMNFGVLALLLGLFLSFSSVLDVVWKRPEESRRRDASEVTEIVNKISTMRQTIVQASIQQDSPELVLAYSSIMAPLIINHLENSRSIMIRLKDEASRITAPQLVMLAAEAMNVYDWEKADYFLKLAEAQKNQLPGVMSEVHRHRAKLLFMTGRMSDGRHSFEASQNAIRHSNHFGVSGQRAWVSADWMLFEMALGDCGMAEGKARDMLDEISHPQILDVQRRGFARSLRTQLKQMDALISKRCDVPQPVRQFVTGA